MNANELAYKLALRLSYLSGLYNDEELMDASKLIIQQQAEIEALKTKGEPVAWYAINRETGIGYVQTSKPTRMDKVVKEYLPLYTRISKDLTDEEINEIVWQQNLLISNDGLRDFARAILRKAQEK